MSDLEKGDSSLPRVEVSKIINAPIDKVFAICSDMVSFAEFMPDVESVSLIEEGANYTITDWKTKLQGKRIEWREREDYDSVNYHIRYEQIKGDLKKMEGEWIFTESEDGTGVTLTMDFEFGLPLLEPVLNPVALLALRKNMNGMLSAIKNKAEL